MKRIITFLSILLFSLSYGQVTFNTIPLDKQLVGRDLNTNLGHVIIEGEVDNSSVNYSSIKVEVYRNDVLQNNEVYPLIYTSNIALFNFDIEILAELANYSLKIYGDNGSSLTLEKEIVDIVAGDVYIIQGQSNAEAKKYSTESSNGFIDPFIRVFFSGEDRSYLIGDEQEWYIGQGDSNKRSNGNTGQWGLKLANSIVNSTNIPVAIFNGADTGKPISFFLAPGDYDQNPKDSNYGRLYYRLNKTGLKDFVRSVIWAQGETDAVDGITSTTDYKNTFNTLKSSWLTDYPNIEDFYIFQTRNGCDSSIESLMEVKEAQRQLAFEDPNIHIMSTAALTPTLFQSCHFVFAGGYESFADRMFPLISRDLYNVAPLDDIDPPMITGAYLQDYTTLIVETDATGLQIDTVAEDFELSNAGTSTITGISIYDTNKIKFTLSEDPGTSAEISYVAQPQAEVGNFITNTNGLELVCFNKYPIDEVVFPVITLIGDNPQFIELGAGYTELSATSDHGSTLVIDDSEFVDALGQYTIYYDANDTFNDAIQVTRTVQVIDSSILVPEITLVGADPQVIELGTGYTELNAFTNNGAPVIIDDSEFVDAVGTYTIYYDASGTEGDEKVVNGVFDTDTDWNKQAGWTIADGVAKCDGSGRRTYLSQNIGLDAYPSGTELLIEYDVVYAEAGAVLSWYNPYSSAHIYKTLTTGERISGIITSNGTYPHLILRELYDFAFEIDNISVKRANDAVQVTREVQVEDTTAPVITLTGDNPQVIALGAGYTELNATTDDGTPVVIDDSEYVDAVGTYTIYYDANDGFNDAVQVTRTVQVLETIITLTGDNPQVIALGAGYTELNATTNTGIPVVIDDSEFVDAVGTYTIYYDATIEGAEEVVNGTFDTDSDWNKQAGWTIADGVAKCDGSGRRTYLSQNIGLDAYPSGTELLIEYDVVYAEAGAVLSWYNPYSSAHIYKTLTTGERISGIIISNGTYPHLILRELYDFAFEIDNISVKRVNVAAQATRTVQVLETIITLTGADPQVIELGDGYTELNATTNTGIPVVIDDSEFVDAVGTYTIYYDATTEGAEKAVNGTFDTDTDWNKQAGWTIADGVAKCDGSGRRTYLSQNIGLDAYPSGTELLIEYDVVYAEAGAVLSWYNPYSSAHIYKTLTTGERISGIITSNGTYPHLILRELYDFAFEIDNISVKRANDAVQVTREVQVEDTTAPVITLTGANPQVVALGIVYTELGATTDDGTPVVIDDSQYVDAVGTYTIYYDANDGFNDAVQVTRMVEVVETIITLTGADPQVIELGAGYTELGATTNTGIPVIIDDSEFVDAVGTYTIYYDATIIGAEKVVNGTFDTDTDWNKGAGWTIAGGVANYDGSGNNTTLSQDIGLDAYPSGTELLIEYDVVYAEAGTLLGYYSPGDGSFIYRGLTTGEHFSGILKSNGSSTDLNLRELNSASFQIDNVSVKQVTYAAQVTRTVEVVAPPTQNKNVLSTTAKVFDTAEITVYPNPASEKLFIDLSSHKAKNIDILLYNMNGQLLMRNDFKNEFNHLKEINLDEFSEGIYLLKLIDKEGVDITTKRIIVDRN